jgi:hypothetical protein
MEKICIRTSLIINSTIENLQQWFSREFQYLPEIFWEIKINQYENQILKLEIDSLPIADAQKLNRWNIFGYYKVVRENIFWEEVLGKKRILSYDFLILGTSKIRADINLEYDQRLNEELNTFLNLAPEERLIRTIMKKRTPIVEIDDKKIYKKTSGIRDWLVDKIIKDFEINNLIKYDVNGNAIESKVHDKQNNTLSGRPSLQDDDWAFNEVVGKGRSKKVVFLEWLSRMSEERKSSLSDPYDSFKKQIRYRKMKQEKGGK